MQGDVVVDVPPDSQVHRQVVRKDADARDDRARSRSCACTTSRCASPTCTTRRATCGACSRRSSASGSSSGLDCDLAVLARAAARRCARASGRSPSPCTTATQIIARLAGLPRAGAYGLAVDVGSTTIAAHLCDLATGEVVASAGHDEPADPLRRRPDEPRLLRDDESRAATAQMTRGGARRARRARRASVAREAGDRRRRTSSS